MWVHDVYKFVYDFWFHLRVRNWHHSDESKSVNQSRICIKPSDAQWSFGRRHFLGEVRVLIKGKLKLGTSHMYLVEDKHGPPQK